MTEPTRDALHAETLDYLEFHAGQHRAVADMYGDIAEEGYAPKLRAEADKLAYAAECVKRVPALEAEVERLTASNRKLTTMLEEEAYHRMEAESRAEPDSGNVRIEVTDSAEVARLRAKAAVVDAINAGEVEQMSGWGNADGPMKFGVRLKGSGPMDFGFGATMQAAYEGALAAYAAATREGTDA